MQPAPLLHIARRETVEKSATPSRVVLPGTCRQWSPLSPDIPTRQVGAFAFAAQGGTSPYRKGRVEFDGGRSNVRDWFFDGPRRRFGESQEKPESPAALPMARGRRDAAHGLRAVRDRPQGMDPGGQSEAPDGIPMGAESWSRIGSRLTAPSLRARPPTTGERSGRRRLGKPKRRLSDSWVRPNGKRRRGDRRRREEFG